MIESQSTRRLLVVDDEPAFCRFVLGVAENLGYTVEIAHNGRDFMTTYTLFQPTTVVMDIVMPEIEGVELTQWLIAQGFAGRLILATGFAPNYVTIAQHLADAASQFKTQTLLKPVGIDELEAALKSA
ncbi:MAG: response regulator [Rhodospirillaceae bacterium]|jgi:two-component system, NtrC family, response regulator AtoC|nr:response regulator [Rhodospirillaceae bacterium]MBT4486069.1 response regulator [Rhodospirillaceae bacterium]MBT5190730.1 response regulator [Rhodospirillaceae bacterium]MBT5897533.1 response regulator [Rhodospirillaceae bacterium]MBT6429383.1 response regulator [Rhodospirillaceae bacterium]